MTTEVLAEMGKPDAANSGDPLQGQNALKPHLCPAMLNSSLYHGRYLSGCFCLLLPGATKKGCLTPQGTIFYFSLQYNFLEIHEQQKATLAVFSPHTTCLHSPMEDTAKGCTLSCAHFILDLSSGTVISYQHLGLGENYPSLLFFRLNKGFWLKYSRNIPTLCFLFGKNNSSLSPVFLQAKYKQGIKGGGGKMEIFLQTQRAATVSSQDSCPLWPLWLKFSEGSISQEAPQWLRKKQGQQRLWSQTSWNTTPLFTATALPNAKFPC